MRLSRIKTHFFGDKFDYPESPVRLRASFGRSLTDPSFYVPNGELNKTLMNDVKNNPSSLGTFDESPVSDEVASMRRPGTYDRTESQEIMNNLIAETKDIVQKDYDKQNEEAIKSAENAQKVAQRDAFIDSVMSSQTNLKSE